MLSSILLSASIVSWAIVASELTHNSASQGLSLHRRASYYGEQSPSYSNQPQPFARSYGASYSVGPPEPAPVQQPEPSYRQPSATVPQSMYSFPNCYQNTCGFTCCNARLESEMRSTYRQLTTSQNGHFKTCNIQKISNTMQDNLQRSFNASFETVTGISDFASRIHFHGDLLCKLEMNGQYILAYGTPGNSRPPPPSPRYIANPQPAYDNMQQYPSTPYSL